MSISADDEKLLKRIVQNLMNLWKVPEEKRGKLVYWTNPKAKITKRAERRIGHLLAIHRDLRQAYEHNQDLCYQYMTTKNSDYGNLSPLDFALLKERNIKEVRLNLQGTLS